MGSAELDAKAEAKEAAGLRDKLEKGDDGGLKEHINRLYSEHGLKELKDVLAKLKGDEEKAGVTVDITERDGGLPDIKISGDDSKTHHSYDFTFDAAKDGIKMEDTKNADGSGSVEMRTANGNEYSLKYDSSGKVTEVTVPGPDGSKIGPLRPQEVTEDGVTKTYFGNSDGHIPVTDVKYDPAEGTLTIVEEVAGGSKSLTYGKDGSETHTDSFGRTTKEIDPDGTERKYSSFDEHGNPAERTVKEFGSPLERHQKVDERTGRFVDTGYEFKDKDRHVEKLEIAADGSWTLTRGDSVEHFPRGSKVVIEGDGDRKITRPDGSSYEGRADGTTIERDAKGRVTEMESPDGTTTSFERNAAGKVIHMEVRDEAGKVVETVSAGKKVEAGGDGYYSNFEDPSGASSQVKEIKVNEKDGSYAVSMENGHRLERKIDGSQDLTDAKGKEIPTKDDEIVKRMKDGSMPLNEAEERKLRADLASISKLPADDREKVYASLDKILTANTDSTTKLTPEERAELATSLAHHIANPESIRQGYKDACVMANTEMTMAKLHPDVYADMVTKLATEGKYTAANGRTVEVHTDKDGTLGASTDSHRERSLTSEVFQDAVATLALPEGQVYKSYVPNSPESRTIDGNLPTGVHPSTDTGDRTIYVNNQATNSGENVVWDLDLGWMGKARAITAFEGFASADRARMLNALVPSEQYEPRPITSAAELVAAYRDNGGPPLNIGFNTKPENNNFSSAEAGDAGAITTENHAVNITHIDFDDAGNPVKIYYDNPAGGPDHSYPRGTGVPVADFVKAVRAGGQRAVVAKGRGS